MLIYNHGSPDKPLAPVHYVSATPAGDPRLAGQDKPSSWVDGENKPVTFEVKFEMGKAEVDEELGRYMTAHGLASRSPLLHVS